MEQTSQSTELTIPVVEEYIEQIEGWDKQVMPRIRGKGGLLPQNWGLRLRDWLVAIAQRENPRLVPLIRARFGADSDLIPQGPESTPVGQPMSGESLDVTGHISHSTLWLTDEKTNTMQTMVRLLVEGDKGKQLIDVYSTPVHPGFTRVEGGGHRANIDATEPSRELNLLRHVEANHLEVLGWVPIPEIPAHQVPSYTKPPVSQSI